MLLRNFIYIIKGFELLSKYRPSENIQTAFFQLKRDTKSHLNLCCERLFCRAADLFHPGKQFVQVIIAAVFDIPRQGVVDGLAVVLQFGG